MLILLNHNFLCELVKLFFSENALSKLFGGGKLNIETRTILAINSSLNQHPENICDTCFRNKLLRCYGTYHLGKYILAKNNICLLYLRIFMNVFYCTLIV